MKNSPPPGTIRPHSSKVFDGDERAAARAMLYPVGFRPEDFQKPLIGIAWASSQVTPCNLHLDQLAREAEQGANEAGSKDMIFNTITVSDGISMGSHVPNAVFESVREHFKEKELVDLTLAIVAINGWNRPAISFRAEPGTSWIVALAEDESKVMRRVKSKTFAAEIGCAFDFKTRDTEGWEAGL